MLVAGSGFSVIFIGWWMVDWLLLNVEWDWNFDGFPDDDFLVDWDLYWNVVWLGNVDDLVDWVWNVLWYLNWIRHVDRLGYIDRLVNGHWLMLEDGDWNSNWIRSGDRHWFWYWDRFGDWDDLFHSLVDWDLDWNMNWMWDSDGLRDRDDFRYMNHSWDWHVFWDVNGLVDDLYDWCFMTIVSVSISAAATAVAAAAI